MPRVQSNQAAKLYAVEVVIDTTPPFAPLHLVMDLKYVLRGMTENLTKWKDGGWLHVTNAAQVQQVVAKLHVRSAVISFH